MLKNYGRIALELFVADVILVSCACRAIEILHNHTENSPFKNSVYEAGTVGKISRYQPSIPGLVEC